MINVLDRVPTRPGRIKITHEDNSVEYVTWERADEPTEEGTPINKVLFDSIKNDLEHEKYSIGEYTGDGSNEGKSITLSFTPRAVLVQSAEAHNNNQYYGRYLGIAFTDRPYLSDDSSNTELIKIINNGFTIKSRFPTDAFNDSGKTYNYIAIE